MEILVEEYFETVGRETAALPKRRGFVARLKPIGKLFRAKTSSSSSSTKELKKNSKADRRKSGSTSDGPSNYDSCDDPSQDHRTEPTTSVESILGLSLSSTHKNRSFRRGISMVPALYRVRSSSSVRAKAVLATRSYDNDDEEETNDLSTQILVNRITSCPVRVHRLTESHKEEEGIELVLDGIDGTETREADLIQETRTKEDAVMFGADRNDEHSEPGRLSIGPAPRSSAVPTSRQSPEAVMPPPIQGEDQAICQALQPKISITTTSFFEPDENQQLAHATATMLRSTTWVSHDDLGTADNRPLKEIIFSNAEDQFDDMDDLTLPPTGYFLPHPPSRPLYSNPIYSPSVDARASPKPAAKPLPTTPVCKPVVEDSPTATVSKPVVVEDLRQERKDPACEEMFASFVEERHGSFRRESSLPPSDVLTRVRTETTVPDPASQPVVSDVQPERDASSPAKSLADSNDTEEDVEVLRINQQVSSGRIRKRESPPTPHPIQHNDKSPSPQVAAATNAVPGQVESNGRDSRLSRLGSLFSLLDNATLRGSSDLEEQQKNQSMTPDVTAELPERVASPPEFVKQLFGSMFRKSGASPVPVPTASNVRLVAPKPVAMVPPSVIWKTDVSVAGSHSDKPGQNSVSGASGSCSGDSLTHDSLMELLDVQAAASGDTRSARRLARKHLALVSSGSDLFGSHTRSDDGSTSYEHRATPVLKTFQCGGLTNMYTSSIDEESFASSDDNLMTELKADLLNTVDELKREGSFVVSKFIRQISNQK